MLRFLKKLLATPITAAPPKITPRAQKVIATASNSGANPTAKQLAIALLALDDGCAHHVLRRLQINFVELRKSIDQDNATIPTVSQSLDLAREEQRNFAHPFLGSEHILLAVIRAIPATAKYFNSQGLDLGAIREEIMRELDPNFDPGARPSTSKTAEPQNQEGEP